MSARDAESGSSTYKGGSGSAGGLGNGGIGGGMGGGGNHGGGRGGGAGRNGGIGNRTGLTTGNKMYGGVARGRPGGKAMNPGAWGVRPAASVTSAAYTTPAVPGILGPVIEDVPMPPAVPSVYSKPAWTSVSDFIEKMKQMYGQPAVTEPMAIKGPGYKGPTGYWQENVTNYPQWSSGGKLSTGNYFSGNTYPGGYNYTDNTGYSFDTIENIDRNGIDRMAKDRGY